MESLFKRIFFGFFCFLVLVSGCSDSKKRSGSDQKNSSLRVNSAEGSIHASNECYSSNEDSLLICDEFRSKFESKKYLCVISYSNECPIAKSYIKTIQNLVKQFGDTIQFCLLDPGVGSRSISGMEDLLFHDNLGVICGRFGVKVYPQAVVMNCLTRSKIYSGKIDDRAVSLGIVSKVATKNYLFDVLANLILGKPNTVVSNEPIGCFVGPFDSKNE
jgi:hypothetical protein